MQETADKKETWNWLRKVDLKVETEAMLRTAQEQEIQTNYLKHKIDEAAQSPLCTPLFDIPLYFIACFVFPYLSHFRELLLQHLAKVGGKYYETAYTLQFFVLLIIFGRE